MKYVIEVRDVAVAVYEQEAGSPAQAVEEAVGDFSYPVPLRQYDERQITVREADAS